MQPNNLVNHKKNVGVRCGCAFGAAGQTGSLRSLVFPEPLSMHPSSHSPPAWTLARRPPLRSLTHSHTAKTGALRPAPLPHGNPPPGLSATLAARMLAAQLRIQQCVFMCSQGGGALRAANRARNSSHHLHVRSAHSHSAPAQNARSFASLRSGRLPRWRAGCGAARHNAAGDRERSPVCLTGLEPEQERNIAAVAPCSFRGVM